MTSPSELSEQQLDAFMSNPWIACLPQDDRDELLLRTHLRNLPAGRCLFRRGGPPDGAYFVIDGVIRLSNTSADGHEALLNFYEPGNWIGEVSMIDGLPRTHDAVAHVPSLVLQITPAHFEELLARYPGFSRQVLSLECLRLRAMLVAFSSFSTQSLEQRLAGRLLGLGMSFGSPGAQGLRIDLHLSQETMAQLIGATRQRVNQVLKKWEAEGMIEHRYGRVTVIDQAMLEAVAQGEA
ncbi:Crp/Fnr family transcriptional regulator [Pseudomonas schmalbachii]|uniref:Crp/Fnr family transcriptional regulator n=1 Tax=Pseudomonas schmalbachii TaxID=2816993 RepID=A0ABS3TJJ1_9PSED|nr:Crp/Fnr family transcriptional regulator [Pseudomonas schmalbachii]MBO3273830.1 Crp/Fnr family transcriptional regulator [Pseudomonas schmalbachii]